MPEWRRTWGAGFQPASPLDRGMGGLEARAPRCVTAGAAGRCLRGDADEDGGDPLLRLLVAVVVLPVTLAIEERPTIAARDRQAAQMSCQNPAPLVVPSEGAALPAATLAALDRLAAAIAPAAASLPGLSVAVVIDQAIVFAAGFGCAGIEQQIGATPQTVYRIESVTKVFEATAMMQQRDAPTLPQNAFTRRRRSTRSSRRCSTSSRTAAVLAHLPRVASHRRLRTAPAAAIRRWGVLAAPGERDRIDAPGVYSTRTSASSRSAIGGPDRGLNRGCVSRLHHAAHPPAAVDDEQHLRLHVRSRRPLPYPTGGFRTQPWIATPSGYTFGISFAGDVYSSVQDMAQIIMLQFRTGPAGGSQVLACSSIQEMWQPVGAVNSGGYSTIGWFVQNYNTPSETIAKNGGAETWARWCSCRTCGWVSSR
jgi:CubicO group peptidase (beta-lactamase class C family)